MSILPEIGFQGRAQALGQRCRQERKTRGLSIAEFAARAGIKPRTYAHFELTGEISLDRLLKVMMVLGRLEEIEMLIRPKGNFATLDEMEHSLSMDQPRRGVR